MDFLKTIYYTVFGIVCLIGLLLIFSFVPITGNYKIMTVLSGSMQPAIKTGSIVLVKPSLNYKIGDVITFGANLKNKTSTTHRISEIMVKEGQPIYITKGDANNAPDSKEVLGKDIIGKVLISVPFLGYAVAAAQKPIGFAILIIVPALIIVLDQAKNIFKEFKKIKKPENDEA